jgi:hypothetical protein
MDTSQSQIQIRFSGALTSVDARTFTSAIVADSALIQQIARVLDPDARVEVRVTAIERGSFDYGLELIGLAASTYFLFDKTGGSLAVAMVKYFIDVHKLKLFSRGDAVKEVSRSGDEVRVENVDGNVEVYNNVTINIYNDPTAANALADKFLFLGRDPSIESVGIFSADQKPLLDVHRGDFEVMGSKAVVIDKDTRVIFDRAHVHPVNFITEGSKLWTVYYNGNRIPVKVQNAKIGDDRFYDVLHAGAIRFGVGDVMDVDMEITQHYDSQYETFVNKAFEITRVHQYIPRQPQGRFEL